MTGPNVPPRSLADAAIDGLASVLFAAFVGILFLGFVDPNVPYTLLATLPLLGSLAVLFWGNLRADRLVRSAAAGSAP